MFLSLEREHHDDSKKESDERHRRNLWDKFVLVPVLAFESEERESRDHACQERNAEIHKHALRYLSYRDIDRKRLQTEPRWKDRQKNVSVN